MCFFFCEVFIISKPFLTSRRSASLHSTGLDIRPSCRPHSLPSPDLRPTSAAQPTGPVSLQPSPLRSHSKRIRRALSSGFCASTILAQHAGNSGAPRCRRRCVVSQRPRAAPRRRNRVFLTSWRDLSSKNTLGGWVGRCKAMARWRESGIYWAAEGEAPLNVQRPEAARRSRAE